MEPLVVVRQYSARDEKRAIASVLRENQDKII
jgi:hypothetical protein